MKNDSLEKMLQNSEIANLGEEFVVLNDEQADDLFGGKYICLVIGSNNGNC